MATSQASTAAAVGRASRLDTRDHLATLAGKERNPLGIGTMAPARGSRTAFRPTRTARMRCAGIAYWFCVLDPPPSRSNPCRSTGEAGLDHPPRPNSGGHLPLAGEGFGFRCAGHCASRAPSPLLPRGGNRGDACKKPTGVQMVQAGGGRTPAPREADAEGTGILGGYAGEVGSLMMTRRGGRGVADGASGGFRTTSSSV